MSLDDLCNSTSRSVNGKTITPIGFLRNGAPVWPIAGGSGDGGGGDGGGGSGGGSGGDGGGGSGGDGGGGSGGGSGGDGDGDDDEPLGEAGKKALDSWKARAKAAEADAKRAKDLEAENAKLKEQTQTESEKAIEKARKEAGEEAAKTEREKWAGRIVKSEVKSAAAATFADPEDAVLNLDLDDYPVDDDGSIDAKKLEKDLAALLERKPHLAKLGADGKPTGSIDQGARGGGAAGGGSDNVKPGLGRMRHAYQNSSKK